MKCFPLCISLPQSDSFHLTTAKFPSPQHFSWHQPGVWQRAASAQKDQPLGLTFIFLWASWRLHLFAAGLSGWGGEKGLSHWPRAGNLDLILSPSCQMKTACFFFFFSSFLGLKINWGLLYFLHNEKFPCECLFVTLQFQTNTNSSPAQLLTSSWRQSGVSAKERQRVWEAVNKTWLPLLTICRF